jgi:hypothetical protein
MLRAEIFSPEMCKPKEGVVSAYIIFEVVVETVLVSAKTFSDLGKQPLNKIPNAFYEY